MSPASRLAHLRARTATLVEQLDELVSAESPSDDPAALAVCAAVIGGLLGGATGTRPELVRSGAGAHLVLRGAGPTRVALVGHYDTVWPAGTLRRWPFRVHGDRASGPGVFDMKAGIVQLAAALATLDGLDGVAVVLTSDEETGSPTSRTLVEQVAAGAAAALVLEPAAPGGALKKARKGTGTYTVVVDGVASHAGLEPEKGRNALVGMAAAVLELGGVGRPELGTTVTPTMATAGTATNVVPATARVEVDVRVWTAEEAERVERSLRGLRPTVEGTSVRVEGGMNRPPLDERLALPLVARAEAAAARLGLGPLGAVAVGGGSDGNFTGAIGTPTLDGLGAVGDHAHGEGEWTFVPALAERAALLAELIEELRLEPA